VAKVDLHLHSSASDGVLSPAGVVNRAVELGLTAIALTDHDNVDGIIPASEAAAGYPSLTFIPGVEINTYITSGEVHILGYFIDYTSPVLLEFLERMRNARLARARKILEKLAGLGMPVEWERVKALAGTGAVGRPHVARAMLEKGYIGTIKEAFIKYLAFGKPAYVPREKITPAEAIKLVVRTGGIPVLAHPLTGDNADPEALAAELVKDGLAGIEAHYGNYPAEDRKRLVRLADKYGLVATGGSDYHGMDDSAEVMMGEAGVPPEAVDELLAWREKDR
jgi:predicted metal-dependent phosphoesterase TrpH